MQLAPLAQTTIGQRILDAVSSSLSPSVLWGFTTGLSLILAITAVWIYLYYRSRVIALTGDSADIAQLAARKNLLQGEVEQCQRWLEENRERLLQMDARVQEMNRLEQELADLQTRLAQTEEQVEERDRELRDMQNAVSGLAEDRNRLKDEIDRLQERLEPARAAAARAEDARKEADSRAQEADKKAQEMCRKYEQEESRLQRLLHDMGQRKAEESALVGAVTGLEAQRKEKEAELDQTQSQLAQLRAEQDKLRDSVAERRKAKGERDELCGECEELRGRTGSLRQELGRLEKEREVHHEQLARTKSELEKLKDSLSERRKAKAERDEFRSECEELHGRIGSLRQELGRLEKERDGLLAQVSGGPAAEDDRYAELLGFPDCLKKSLFSEGAQRQTDEREALARVQKYLKSAGLLFPDRTVKAFHTSLKVSEICPLTVLAGVSGTGKTELPIRYARAMGIHSLVLSVQPGWNSPQDLFGFYNYLEKRYKATELVKALIRMDKYHMLEYGLDGRDESPPLLLVLLDEMNLARVEYYFSEFLSKLEIRRTIADPDNGDERQEAEFELDTGPGSSTKSPHRVWVSGNVLFAGTMNEDETTQTLSDKVLDRGNVLRFARPQEGTVKLSGIADQEVARSHRYLPYSQWQQWIRPPQGHPWDKDVDQWTEAINRALDKVGRPFGHRVVQAIRAYVRNYPGVDDGSTHRTAFADQVEQKVLPKLRGVDMMEPSSSEALDETMTVVTELADDCLREAFQRSIDQSVSSGTFLWRGVTRPV